MNNLKQKITLILYVFPKLQTVNDVVNKMSKKSGFIKLFNNLQHDSWSQILLKSKRQCLYHIYSSLWRKLSWKKSLLVICKILGLFVNTLTANDRYSHLNTENLRQPSQIQLSNKLKSFSQLFLWIFQI